MEEPETLVVWAADFIAAHPVRKGGFDDPMLRAQYLDNLPRLTNAARAADALGRPSDALRFLKPCYRLLLRLSRWADAEPLLDHARELAERVSAPGEAAAVWNALATLYGQTERKDDAARADASALSAARRWGQSRSMHRSHLAGRKKRWRQTTGRSAKPS